ncbi:hypothetical protein J6590_006541 [Homalodisca vitripennis]|nr:hypothetical protein J6590_006541 [Homalodisca vitripennis]
MSQSSNGLNVPAYQSIICVCEIVNIVQSTLISIISLRDESTTRVSNEEVMQFLREMKDDLKSHTEEQFESLNDELGKSDDDCHTHWNLNTIDTVLTSVPVETVYMNESLSLARKQNYTYVWVKNGNVFLRKDEENRSIVLNNLHDVNELK